MGFDWRLHRLGPLCLACGKRSLSRAALDTIRGAFRGRQFDDKFTAAIKPFALCPDRAAVRRDQTADNGQAET
jgi:hypothetical protein